MRRAWAWLPRLALSLGLLLAEQPTSALLVAGLLGPGTAQAQASRSGGYSRPGGGFSRGGGFGGGSFRRPSVGGSSGYSRPSRGGYSGGFFGGAGGDRAINRRSSGEAFRNYRNAQRPAPAPRPAPPDRRPSTWGNGGYFPAPTRRPYAPSPYAPSPYAGGSGGSGVLSAALLFALLNNLSSANSARYFHNNQNAPGYADWRRDAEREAQNDPALAAKLDKLDQQLARIEDQPRNPGAPPPIANPTQQSAAPQAQGGGSWTVIIVLLVGVGGLAFLWWRRRQAGAAKVTAPPALRGSDTMRLRVGMTIPADPTPFLLAADATKVRAPEGEGAISVAAVGLVQDGPVALHRLYLPGRQGFFALHLGGRGAPDECRYFSQLDEVTPATQDEWGFWLDPAQGMIGWPVFQTKDGKTYPRAWSPGQQRVAPRLQQETIEDPQGTRTRTLRAMLYAGPTDAAPPAPQTEYILVCAVDDAGRAWVEVFAGIDINPASLSLPSVPLQS